MRSRLSSRCFNTSSGFPAEGDTFERLGLARPDLRIGDVGGIEDGEKWEVVEGEED